MCNFKWYTICFPTCVSLCVAFILNQNNQNQGRNISYFDYIQKKKKKKVNPTTKKYCEKSDKK